MNNVVIRKAERQDVPLLLEFIKGIARGYGKAMLLHLVRIAKEHHCRRMEWTCLNWNQPSIDFYLSLGAVPMKEWTIYRLNAAALEPLA